MTDRIYYTKHDGGVTMLRAGKHSVCSNTHPNYQMVLEALRERKFDKVEELMSIEKLINAKGRSKKLPGRRVFVEKGRVFYTDSHDRVSELNGTLVDRILTDMGKKSFNKYAEALLAFMDNVKKNKLKDIRQELYEWLMSGKTPITYDGCFLAYKNVDRDYKDLYTHKIDNSVGAIPRMPQDTVDRDRNNTCSVGLHFCSREYLHTYDRGNGGHTMIVKVNPRHVFAIPVDYHFQKGRASEYFVVGEYNGDLKADAFRDAFIDEDTKATSCPDVKFGGWLLPSLENMAKSYGLLNKHGEVFIIEARGRKIPVRGTPADGVLYDIIGTPQPIDGWTSMSLKTKSVREAMKAAIRKAEKGFYRS